MRQWGNGMGQSGNEAMECDNRGMASAARITLTRTASNDVGIR